VPTLNEVSGIDKLVTSVDLIPKEHLNAVKGGPVILDEASMLGLRHATMLLKYIEKTGATLVLVGDGWQRPPVGDAAVYNALCEYLGAATLSGVTRQNQAWARKAVKDLQDGNIEAALSAFKKHGCFAEVDDPIASIVWDWWHHAACESVESALIVAKTNAEVEALNDACQETLLRMNRLSGTPAKISDCSHDRTYEASVYVGDRVIFSRNSHKFRDGFQVRNGSRGTVVATSPTGKISVRLDTKKDDWKVKLSSPVPADKLGMARLSLTKSSRPAEGMYYFSDKKAASRFLEAINPLGLKAKLLSPKHPKRPIRVTPSKFPYIRRGYATTDYKAQGDTIPKVFVLLGSDSPSTYVQLSRHPCGRIPA
jgi:ATP-dependent exoDNAse (exonuclease V) alpha subunit